MDLLRRLWRGSRRVGVNGKLGNSDQVVAVEVELGKLSQVTTDDQRTGGVASASCGLAGVAPASVRHSTRRRVQSRASGSLHAEALNESWLASSFDGRVAI
ncbi:hypothetical protein Bca4012_042345 [Brassica carinata]|uniref:Uncharacterized protein n=2 Tax=Brassica TaxID=3705 RepID=A0A3P6DSW3_BRAOL|nr:unnamed protein product [Brassica napus]CDY45479.1 BnaC09g12970D [Brassica napus]VDD29496.1 unnamed protein product [Brassica oleracea]